MTAKRTTARVNGAGRATNRVTAYAEWYHALPKHPVTHEEVLGWFADKPRKTKPQPTRDTIGPIVEQVESWLIPLRPENGGYTKGSEPWRWVIPLTDSVAHIARGLNLLEQSIAIADSEQGRHPENALIIVRRAIAANKELLRVWRPQKRGAPPRNWDRFAVHFAETVEQVLLASGWDSVGVTSDAAVVPHIVARMAERAFGEKVSAQTVARFLRSPQPAAGSKRKWPQKRQ